MKFLYYHEPSALYFCFYSFVLTLSNGSEQVDVATALNIEAQNIIYLGPMVLPNDLVNLSFDSS